MKKYLYKIDPTIGEFDGTITNFKLDNNYVTERIEQGSSKIMYRGDLIGQYGFDPEGTLIFFTEPNNFKIGDLVTKDYRYGEIYTIVFKVEFSEVEETYIREKNYRESIKKVKQIKNCLYLKKRK